MRRVALVAQAVLALVLLGSAVPMAAELPDIVVYRAGDQTLSELLPEVMPPDGSGSAGVALLSHTEDLDESLHAVEAYTRLDVSIVPVTDVPELGSELGPERPSQTWIVSEGRDGLGAVILIVPAAGAGSVGAMTSDSTRRDGVVVVEDLLPTMWALAGLPAGSGVGSAMRITDEPAPLELEARHAANRRMTVPIQTAAGLYVASAGLLGVALLSLRRRVPAWLSSLGAWVAIAVVPLGVSLLLAGHLGSLTYPTVAPALVGGTVSGCLAAAVVAGRWGTMTALAVLGAVTILVFVLEAALGWTAALTPFLGGSELDGGRFYGLPNVDIGLLLGAGVFAAHRYQRTWPGVALLSALALFAGLPFAGANLGAAVTLGAGAGLWWGFRGDRSMVVSVCAAIAGAAAAGAATLLANVALPGWPTHISRFAEGEGGGVVGTVVDRLQVGLDLIVQNPFALLPVIGVPATLLAVTRPAASVRASFERHPGWRESLLTILWASVVAYFANDTGAAATGLGFGTALGGLLFVSLRDRPWMMVTS